MGDFEALGLFAPEPLSQRHHRSGFSCGNAGLDRWLLDVALHNQRADYTRTFVICDAALRVKAYYALCAGMLLRKDATRTAAPHGAPAEIPIALLPRLAVHQELQGRGIGKALLTDALRNAALASRTVAFRALVVDAVDDEAATFYHRLGFRKTKISPLRMLLPMQDIIASIANAQ